MPHPLGELLVAGGSDDWWDGTGNPDPVMRQDYEAFRPGARGWPTHQRGSWRTLTGTPTGSRLFPGPTSQPSPTVRSEFSWYPRLFLLPDGRMVSIGINAQTTIATHPTATPASWTNLGVRSHPGFAGYGAALLAPNLNPTLGNTLINIAGEFYPLTPPFTPLPRTTVEWANLAATSPGDWPVGFSWTALPSPTAQPSLVNARKECNAVILPTGDIMVLGDGSSAAVRTPELLRGGLWQQLPMEESVRDHHSGALLLRSGKVLSMGGNNRSRDFQVYAPWYINMPRPAWVGGAPGGGIINRGTWVTATISLPPGETIGKVVLMRPGSGTHHGDMDQRYIQLTTPLTEEAIATTVTFQAPAGPPGPGGGVRAPLGHYMIFLVTASGVPSVAEFVRFQ